jgi:hypothetical protein
VKRLNPSNPRIASGEFTFSEKSADLKISVTVPFTGAGDLESAVENGFKILFPGFTTFDRVTGFANSDQWSRGETAEGVPYVMLQRDIGKGSGESEVKRCAGVVGFKVGDRVVFAYGDSTHVSAAFQFAKYEVVYDQFVYLIHRIRFKGRSAAAGLKFGGTTWSAFGSGTGSEIKFNADKSFEGASAFSSRVEYDATRDKVTTTSWVGDGSWSQSGDTLTMTYHRTKASRVYLTRLYWEKLPGGGWTEQLGMMSLDGIWREATYRQVR